ncbi:class I SAM-dependent methyltransferase [Streptomyces sp. NPDC056670]|uniref:class I SAM-dependent methyltransferase n=1 Tax=Streptomyces sp. NPDC056670 TaxID=3345904 RepID=UPI0036D178BB
MDATSESEAAAWDGYAAGERNQIWVLIACGPGTAFLDLGFGSFANLAAIADRGGRAVGVDVSEHQVTVARAAHGDRLELHHGTADRFLSGRRKQYDAIVSVFDAVWFTEPALLRPVIWSALRPGGMLVFSHRPPEAGEHGPTPHSDVLPVYRCRTRPPSGRTGSTRPASPRSRRGPCGRHPPRKISPAR